MSQHLTRRAVSELLSEQCAASGSMTAWGKRYGFSAGFVSDVIRRRREPSERLLLALGLRRVDAFAVIGNGPPPPEDALGRALSVVLPEERRALLWLPSDGRPRDRRVRDGSWRPGPDLLTRLGKLGLAVRADDGWAATALGLEGQIELAGKEAADG
jgi:hypothetical protein